MLPHPVSWRNRSPPNTEPHSFIITGPRTHARTHRSSLHCLILHQNAHLITSSFDPQEKEQKRNARAQPYIWSPDQESWDQNAPQIPISSRWLGHVGAVRPIMDRAIPE
jgi:hypothetical protein